MSTDFSIRPVGSPAPSPVVAQPGHAASQGVATELPAGQTVAAADAGSAARNDAQDAGADSVSHQAYFDRDAASMVFQVVSATDQVVEQFPDDATLRRRAYFHTLDMTKSDVPRVMPTDRTA
jgi:hypothetical protein